MKSFRCTRTYRVSDADVKKFANVAMNLAVNNGDVSFRPFGGSIGGPFVKDKLFGFFAIERERESQGLQESINACRCYPSSLLRMALQRRHGLDN